MFFDFCICIFVTSELHCIHEYVIRLHRSLNIANDSKYFLSIFYFFIFGGNSSGSSAITRKADRIFPRIPKVGSLNCISGLRLWLILPAGSLEAAAVSIAITTCVSSGELS